jgi:hypothetical protein
LSAPSRSVAVAVLVLAALLIATAYFLSMSPGDSPVHSPTQPARYAIEFSETGLPGGMPWSVAVGNSTQTGTAPGPVNFSLANGTYAFAVPLLAGFGAAPSSGQLTVNGTPVAMGIAFHPVYAVTFHESGLPTGLNWAVSLNGTWGSAPAPDPVTFSAPNGSLPFAIHPPSGYQAEPPAGTATVSGSAASLSIVFRSSDEYPVTFQEMGLPGATMWSVTLSNVQESARAPGEVSFLEPNGSYPFAIPPVSGFLDNVSVGTVAVHGGPVTVPVRFEAVYAITFFESGLPANGTWSVTLNGTRLSNATPGPILFVEPNGSYPFQVAFVPGYVAAPTSGTENVRGAAVDESIQFTRLIPTYRVTFFESGLSSGQVWNVTFNGTTNSTLAPGGNEFVAPNGTYSFSVSGFPSRYFATPAFGTVRVDGQAVNVTVTFQLWIQHVVVIMLENEERSTVLAQAPYEAYLSAQYGQADYFYATCHSSTSDYMALTSGDTFGCVSTGVVTHANIADVLESQGMSWMAYMESMPSPCTLGTSGTYTGGHNPFVHYSDIRYNAVRCTDHVVNSASFNQSVASGSLPSYSFYTPNTCNDGEIICGANASQCPNYPSVQNKTCESIAVGQIDAWLQGFLTPMLNHTRSAANGLDYASPAERALMNHTAFFVLYDEGTSQSGYTLPGETTQGCVNQTGGAGPLTACGGRVLMTVVSPFSSDADFTANATTYQVQSTIDWLFALGDGYASPDGGLDGTPDFPSFSSLFTFP